jgi:hypothetical protein
MPGDYRERLELADALVQRARNARERETFEEIAATWRRVMVGDPSPQPPSTGKNRPSR